MINFSQNVPPNGMYQKPSGTLQTHHQEGIKKFFLKDLIKESSLKNENPQKSQNNANNEINRNVQNNEKDSQQNKRNLAFDVIYTWETDETSGLRFINVVNKKDKKKLGFQCIYCRDKQLFKKKSSVLYHLVTFKHSLKTSVVDDLKGCRFESDHRLEFISNLNKEKIIEQTVQPIEKIQEKENDNGELIQKELEFISTLYLLSIEELKELFFFYFQDNPLMPNDNIHKETIIEQFIQKINSESEKYSNLLKKVYDSSNIKQQPFEYLSLDDYLKEFTKEKEKDCILSNSPENKPIVKSRDDEYFEKEESIFHIENGNVPKINEKQYEPISKNENGNSNYIKKDSLQENENMPEKERDNQILEEAKSVKYQNEEAKASNKDLSKGKEEALHSTINQIVDEDNKEYKDKEIHDLLKIINILKYSENVLHKNVLTNAMTEETKKKRKYKKRESKNKDITKPNTDQLSNCTQRDPVNIQSKEMNIQTNSGSKPFEINPDVSRENSHDVNAHILSILLNMKKQTKKRKTDSDNNVSEHGINIRKQCKPDFSQLDLTVLKEIIQKIQTEPTNENEKEQHPKEHMEVIKQTDECEKTQNENIKDVDKNKNEENEKRVNEPIMEEKKNLSADTDHSKDKDQKENEPIFNYEHQTIEIKDNTNITENNEEHDNVKLNANDKRIKPNEPASMQMCDKNKQGNLKKNKKCYKQRNKISKKNIHETENKGTTKIKTPQVIQNPKKKVIKSIKKNLKQRKMNQRPINKNSIKHKKKNTTKQIDKENKNTNKINTEKKNCSLKEKKPIVLSPVQTRRQVYANAINSAEHIKKNATHKKNKGYNKCNEPNHKMAPSKIINKQNKKNKKIVKTNISITNKNKTVTSGLFKENIINFEDPNHNSQTRCCRLSRYIKT